MSDPLVRRRVLALAAASFLMMVAYSLARPSVESIFLEQFDQEALPFAWVLVAVGAAGVAAWWSRLVGRGGLVRLYARVAFASAGILVVLLALLVAGVPGTPHALYVWRDVHIVVLIETFYAFANAAFRLTAARWLYGFFGLVGALGSVVGNLAVGALAHRIGTVGALALVPALLLLIGAGALPFARSAELRPDEGGPGVDEPPAAAGPREALRVVRRSDYLLLVLALVALAQVVVTLVDYEFLGFAERAFPEMDARTGVLGDIYAVAAVGTFVLHAVTGPTLRLVGVPGALLFIPALLGAAVSAYVLVPAFLVIATLKVCSKVFDYTLFRSAKEMLYIPLSYAEKTRGKAVVDLLTYRAAKAGASLLLLLLLEIGAGAAVPFVTLTLVALWIVLTVPVVRRFRRRAPRELEMHGSEGVVATTATDGEG